jgi:uncharacterized protein YecA (UPF0149 family)
MMIVNNRALAKERAEKAYKFVIENWSWDIVGEIWRDLFKEALIVEKKVKVGRNDPCFCGSKKKYKNCCLKNE